MQMARILAAVAVLAVGPALDAHARVTRLEIVARQDLGTFQPGDYVRWDGRVHGELSPAAEAIPDLDKPRRNAAGTVDYAAAANKIRYPDVSVVSNIVSWDVGTLTDAFVVMARVGL